MHMHILKHCVCVVHRCSKGCVCVFVWKSTKRENVCVYAREQGRGGGGGVRVESVRGERKRKKERVNESVTESVRACESAKVRKRDRESK